ncbi:copper homeostasis protein [Nakamurella panacisegetis]|uniref:PF03932 family protein CutC n=1 Tax=Nakamurella panacisegetis TaxID=1090615 RepID=A0A1H0JPH7_9ACTN|nr:copper homeostasis protein CutC [Nakamurella panacisegetis]SDO45628.1 copper homeostasis protein [Nakamurella panacisegetis]
MTTVIGTEVCVQSTLGARAAVTGGADRIELCAALELGGITPSAGLIESVVDVIDTHVLIRPRAGDFVYDRDEIRVMAKDVEHAIDKGARSVVIGALTEAGDIDLPAMTRLLNAAQDVPVTFHRAFDATRDPLAALDVLLELGVNRLLTSGARPTAQEGLTLLAELIRRAGDELVVMPGSGVTPANAADIVRATGAREIHFSARRPIAVAQGRGPLTGPLDGGERYETSADLVRATVVAVTDLP